MPCREANAKAPETGAEQLILQTSFPAMSEPVQKEGSHRVRATIAKDERWKHRKQQNELDPGIYRAPDMILATPDASQIPWKRIKLEEADGR